MAESAKKINLREVLGFLILGCANAAVNYACYAILLWLGFHYLVGSIVGFVVSVAHAWAWQYFVIFKEGGVLSDTPWWKTFIKTYLSYGFTGFILANVLLVLALDVVHIESLFALIFSFPFFMFDTPRAMAEYIAPLAIMVINVPINYLLNKLWSFGNVDNKETSGGDENGNGDIAAKTGV